MRIVVTDTGNIWNHRNPYLERYKDIVTVVCLNGKAVTDKYECFVPPYKNEAGGHCQYGGADDRYKALASIARNLCHGFDYHDDIVFLTDNEPSTLYPFHAVKKMDDYKSYHLVAMSPWRFESNRIIKAHNQMLGDLSDLTSFLYYDSSEALAVLDGMATLTDAEKYVIDYLGELLPTVLNGIYNMEIRQCFFDFSEMKYLHMAKGFSNVRHNKNVKTTDQIEFSVYREIGMLGMICPERYLDNSKHRRNSVERLVARLDGKKICNILREQRILFAEANGIRFESEKCLSIGPCAGTCEKCDAEIGYLMKMLKEIPKDDRVYPFFDLAEEVTL